jgi:hypothetical protein
MTVILRRDPGLLSRGSLEGGRPPIYPRAPTSLSMGAFVYILLCADRSYYVGSATGEDLAPRIAQHNSGFYGGYTSTQAGAAGMVTAF